MNPALAEQLDQGNAREAQASSFDPPDDVGEVLDTVTQTVGALWGDFVVRIPFLLTGLVVLLLTWLVTLAFKRLVGHLPAARRMRGSLRDLFTRLGTIAIWAAGLTVAMVIVFPGLTPARAFGALGLVSIAVGFAFKDIFENFFAGILLLWRFPFETGDFVECEGIMGSVQEVTIRMTQIRLTTGELVVVPNSFLFKNPVRVLTDQPRRRVTIVAGVAYGEDVAEATHVIEEAVRSCDTVDHDRPIQVFPEAFGSSSIDIEVAWWTEPEPVDVRRSRGEVVTAIKAALDEAGIEIPFPYRTLTFKEPLPIASADRADSRAEGPPSSNDGARDG